MRPVQEMYLLCVIIEMGVVNPRASRNVLTLRSLSVSTLFQMN